MNMNKTFEEYYQEVDAWYHSILDVIRDISFSPSDHMSVQLAQARVIAGLLAAGHEAVGYPRFSPDDNWYVVVNNHTIIHVLAGQPIKEAVERGMINFITGRWFHLGMIVSYQPESFTFRGFLS